MSKQVIKREGLTQSEIISCFENARAEIFNFKAMYGVKCSTNIIFCSFTQHEDSPITIWYNDDSKMFGINFSSKFTHNSAKKITKLFIRHFLSTNEDGSFKSWQETLLEGDKIAQANNNKREYQYLDTLSNLYLKCDTELIPNAYCIKCKNKYCIDLSEIDEVCCPCGGGLTVISDSEEKEENNVEEQYAQINYDKAKKQEEILINTDMFTWEFFANLNIQESDFEEFHETIENLSSMRIRLLTSLIQEAVRKNNLTLAKMYKKAFPNVYDKCIKYLGKKTYCAIEGIENKRKPRILKQTTPIVELNREDYKCTDEDFLILTNYAKGRKSGRTMKILLKEAIQAKNEDLIACFKQADKETFEATLKYIGKKNLRYLRAIGVLDHEYVTED